jgi:hypothetical protein
MLLLDLDRIFDNDRPRMPGAPNLTPEALPAEWRDVYEERAAIREYDGGLPRELAEHYALLDVLEMMKKRT